MNYAIVYSSRTGNTKMLADTISTCLDPADIIYSGVPSDEALKADYIFIGFWTDKGSCDELTLEFLNKVKNKNIFLFGTAGFGQESAYFEKVLSNVRKHVDDSNTISGSYMCQGKMPLSVRERYEKMMDSPIHAPNIKGLIENFDQALSHPDAKDLTTLKALIQSLH